jgi:hypothetical protein
MLDRFEVRFRVDHFITQSFKQQLRWSSGQRAALSCPRGGSNPAESVGFFGQKNPQHAFLRRGSKAVCPMSQICGMLKTPGN